MGVEIARDEVIIVIEKLNDEKVADIGVVYVSSSRSGGYIIVCDMKWWFYVLVGYDCLYVVLIGGGDSGELYGVVYVGNESSSSVSQSVFTDGCVVGYVWGLQFCFLCGNYFGFC